MDGNAEAASHFNGPGLHDAGAELCHFQHFAIRDFLHFLRVGNDAGVRRIYAVYVRINFAHVGVDRTGNGDSRRIRAAAAQGRNIAVARNALEPCDDDDVAFVQRFHNAVRF